MMIDIIDATEYDFKKLDVITINSVLPTEINATVPDCQNIYGS